MVQLSSGTIHSGYVHDLDPQSRCTKLVGRGGATKRSCGCMGVDSGGTAAIVIQWLDLHEIRKTNPSILEAAPLSIITGYDPWAAR